MALLSDLYPFCFVFGRNIKYLRRPTAVTCWPEVMYGGGPEVDVST